MFRFQSASREANYYREIPLKKKNKQINKRPANIHSASKLNTINALQMGI